MKILSYITLVLLLFFTTSLPAWSSDCASIFGSSISQTSGRRFVDRFLVGVARRFSGLTRFQVGRSGEAPTLQTIETHSPLVAKPDIKPGTEFEFYFSHGNYGSYVSGKEWFRVKDVLDEFQGRTAVVYLQVASMQRVDGRGGAISPWFDRYIASDSNGIYSRGGRDETWSRVLDASGKDVSIVDEATVPGELGNNMTYRNGVLTLQNGLTIEGVLYREVLKEGEAYYLSTLGLIFLRSADESNSGYVRPGFSLSSVSVPSQ